MLLSDVEINKVLQLWLNSPAVPCVPYNLLSYIIFAYITIYNTSIIE